MRSHRTMAHDGEQPLAGWRYLLPGIDGGTWALFVPAALANCVGRYARIPDFARGSALLDRSPLSAPTDMNVDAARRP